MVSSSSLIMSIKAVLISTGVLALALLLKISVRPAMDFSVSTAPIIWSSLLSWLKPPYLYVVINLIIITIAASSRFHWSNRDEEDVVIIDNARKLQTEQIFHRSPQQKTEEVSADPMTDFVYQKDKDLPRSIDVMELAAEIVYEAGDTGSVEDGGDEPVVSTSTWNPPESTALLEIAPPENLPVSEKPLVSARFEQQKTVKATSEGGIRLGLAKPKRHETLENTWEMITEGRNHGRRLNIDTSAFQKCETFRDRTNYQPPLDSTASPLKLRKEPSLSQEELNRRVEAFIKKFNEDMRLQRLESLKQYKEIIGRRV